MAGTLSDPDSSLAHRLGAIASNALSGVLTVTRTNRRRSFEMADGALVSADSSIPAERLLQQLASRGKLTPAQLAVSDKLVASGQSARDALLRTGAIPEDRIPSVLQWHARMLLVGAFAWPRPSVTFSEQPIEGAGVALPTLVAQGVLGRLTAEELKQWVVGRDEQRPGLRAPLPFPLSSLGLDEPEREWVLTLDGRRPLGQVLGFSPLPPDRVLRLVFLLVSLGMLELAGEFGAQRAAAADVVRARPRRSGGGLGASLFGAGSSLEAPMEAPASSHEVVFGSAPPDKDPPAGFVPARPAPSKTPTDGLSSEELAFYRKLETRLSDLEHTHYFEWLGVPVDADEAAIRQAYRDAAKLFHPDRLGNMDARVVQLARDLFGQITDAYQVLTDRKKRKAYIDHEINGLPTEEEKALAQVQKVMEAEQHFKRGERLMNAGSLKDAAVYFEKAIDAYPEEPAYLAHLGWVQFRMGHPRNVELTDKGESLMRKAIKMNEKSPVGWLMMARMYHLTRDFSSARAYLRKVLKISPRNAEAVNELERLQATEARHKPESKGMFAGLFRRLKR